jgi:hypothetical protein
MDSHARFARSRADPPMAIGESPSKKSRSNRSSVLTLVMVRAAVVAVVAVAIWVNDDVINLNVPRQISH